MCKTQRELSSEEIFDYVKMFNYLAVSDAELSARLPETEFELNFNRDGDLYVNGKPVRVNVKQRYEALGLR